MADALPWLGDPLATLEARERSGTMPHALLFGGARGLGKFDLARMLARSILCESPDGRGAACGACPACALTRAGSHPDLRVVTLEDGKQDISVEQIRALTRFLVLTSQRGRGKIAIISPAERMNASAFNALLKTLEEPTPGTVLVLVSAIPGRLPATIRSRCQAIKVPPASDTVARAWLEARGTEAPEWAVRQSEGAPLRVLALLEGDAILARKAFFEQFEGLTKGYLDVTAVCEGVDADATRFRLGLLIGWIQDMVRIRFTGCDSFVRSADLGTELASVGGGIDAGELFRRLERAETAARLCDSSVNRQLLLEDTLLPWCHDRAENRAGN